LYRLALTSGGAELIRMRKDPAVEGQVKVLTSSVLDNTTNLVLNPAQREWSGASSDPPDGWTKYQGSTLTRTTTDGFWVYGGKSCRVQNTPGAGGLHTNLRHIYVPAWATTIVGSIWIRWATFAGTPQAAIYRNNTPAGGGTLVGSVLNFTTPQTGVFIRYDLTASISSLAGALHSFMIWFAFGGGGGTGDCYVDSAQLTFTSAARPFTEGSSPARLLAMANRYLTQFSDDPVAYQCSYADVHAWDPAGFPYETIVLGQTTNIRDPELELIETGRLMERRRNWKQPLASRLTVANRLDDLVTQLTGINR
jgi:hypothetical protein